MSPHASRACRPALLYLVEIGETTYESSAYLTSPLTIMVSGRALCFLEPTMDREMVEASGPAIEPVKRVILNHSTCLSNDLYCR